MQQRLRECLSGVRSLSLASHSTYVCLNVSIYRASSHAQTLTCIYQSTLIKLIRCHNCLKEDSTTKNYNSLHLSNTNLILPHMQDEIFKSENALLTIQT